MTIQAAFVFNPLGEDETPARPLKRRKVTSGSSSKKVSRTQEPESPSTPAETTFVPLVDGKESAACVRRREELFESAWSRIDGQIQHVLREANRTTLEEVGQFVKQASDGARTTKIPAGFIVTGPNIASQDLLFAQLGEEVQRNGQARFVKLKSAEATNFKATLKKIIRDGTAKVGAPEEEGDEAVGQDGRKYLAYDLEALYATVKAQDSRQVVLAFQDSEGFDGGLLSDLITLFGSWLDRIHFTLLFGIATSVELFQARLLKSAARQLYGAQFDVAQANTVLENVFKVAVAGADVVLRLGPSFLKTLVDRHHDQVAGVQEFIGSLKYAYMCHFYANPLSILPSIRSEQDMQLLQTEHLTAVRTLRSFRDHVEAAVEAMQLNHAQKMVEDDEYLARALLEQVKSARTSISKLLRSLHLTAAVQAPTDSFVDLYISALAEGIDLSEKDALVIDFIERLSADETVALLNRLINAIKCGAPDINLAGWEPEVEDEMESLTNLLNDLEDLMAKSHKKGNTLKSKYSAQSKVLRTTVVAQKVQLSRDTATLTAEDKAFTEIVDKLTKLLSDMTFSEGISTRFLHEAFVYESKSPHRDVFMPRPGATVEGALTRPHDYLACSCCAKAGGEITATSPTVAILYHLYQEAGALINVADLCSAYSALVGDESESGFDERAALVQFYRGLAELRAMGFVKQSRRKVDHIAKVKWL
jgi:origin recognition complex subunit 3